MIWEITGEWVRIKALFRLKYNNKKYDTLKNIFFPTYPFVKFCIKNKKLSFKLVLQLNEWYFRDNNIK